MKKTILAALLLALLLCACGGASKSGEMDTGMDGGDFYAEDTPSPLDLSEAQDFSDIAGVWHNENGTGSLTIYENGGFRLTDNASDLEGYLVYTTEVYEGEWVKEPRYEMYLENNEMLPGTYLVPVQEALGELDYVVNGGAERYTRSDAFYLSDWTMIRAQWADNVILDYWGEYGEAVIDDDASTIGVLLTTTGTLNDFQILSISYEGEDQQGPIFSTETLHEQRDLTADFPLLAHLSFPGDMPTRGISFTDAEGYTWYLSISQSGLDGSPVLGVFYPPAAVG